MSVVAAATPRTVRPWYAVYVLVVLFLIYVLASIDRQILAVMVDPLRQHYGLLDSQVSLLPGLAFVLMYATASFPAARLADHHKRKVLIAGGLVVWSVFTGLFAVARSYWQLFVYRMGVGLGEACLGPAAIPLLADCFSARNIGKAVSVYMLAVPVGNGLANMLGGQLLESFMPGKGFDLVLIGTILPWQLLLLIFAGIGFLLLLLLLMTVREPARRANVVSAVSAADARYSLVAVWRFLIANMLVYIAVGLPLLASALMYFGVGYWIPSYFIRSAQVGTQASADLVFYWGVINVVAGAAGVLLGGFLSDFLSARYLDGMWKTLAIGTLLLGLGFTLFSLVAHTAVSLLLLVLGVLGNGIIQAAGITTVLKITPNSMRGQVAALYFLGVNLIGAGIGPTFITALAAFLAAGNEGLGQAMALTAVVSCSLALFMLMKTATAFKKMQQR